MRGRGNLAPTIICIYKGGLPIKHETIPNCHYAAVDDDGKAAQDWPDLNFSYLPGRSENVAGRS